MFSRLVFLHWKSSRAGLLILALAAFGLPLFAVQGLGHSPALPEGEVFYALAFDYLVLRTTALTQAMAAVVGAVLALTAWTWDHREGHVYALSLPTPRWKYVTWKMGAGTVLLLAVSGAFLLGAFIASAAVEPPEGWVAYPVPLFIRFFLGALVVYSMVFAMAAGTFRTTLWVLGILILLPVFGGGVTDFIASNLLPSVEGWDPALWLMNTLTDWPGPFHIFSGSWALFDV